MELLEHLVLQLHSLLLHAALAGYQSQFDELDAGRHALATLHHVLAVLVSICPFIGALVSICQFLLVDLVSSSCRSSRYLVLHARRSNHSICYHVGAQANNNDRERVGVALDLHNRMNKTETKQASDDDASTSRPRA